jgi:hypothetical protein
VKKISKTRQRALAGKVPVVPLPRLVPPPSHRERLVTLLAKLALRAAER